jgi:hypothetical protein
VWDGAAASSSTDSSATPPVLQVNGDNPAIVQIGATYTDLALQLLFLRASESMGNHDSKVVDADSVD